MFTRKGFQTVVLLHSSPPSKSLSRTYINRESLSDLVGGGCVKGTFELVVVLAVPVYPQ